MRLSPRGLKEEHIQGRIKKNLVVVNVSGMGQVGPTGRWCICFPEGILTIIAILASIYYAPVMG